MLQSTVKRYLPVGSAGQIYQSDHAYMNTVEKVVVDDVTFVGAFVQSATNAGECKLATGTAITGTILGVVVKDELRNSTSDTALVLKGSNQTILNVGNIYIEADGVVAEDYYVFLNTTTGALAFNATNTLASHTYTGFKVAIGNSTTGRCLIGITTARA